VHSVSDFEELFSYFLHMASVPSGEWTDRDTDQRPGTAPSSDGPTGHRAAPGRHRPPRRRRWLWTSGLASAVIGASLVTPWPSVTSATRHLAQSVPSYYGAAWAALGRLVLTDDVLGGCPPVPTAP